MSECLVFDSEEKTIIAQKRIWINQVKKRAAEGENLVGTGTVHYTDLSGLTDDQISQLKIYSRRNGENIDTSLPATKKYAEVKKIYEVESWYIPMPSEEFMIGVSDYTIESRNSNWDEPGEA